MDAFLLVALQTVCLYAPAASQVVLEDTVILHPVQPASGLSACPGQDVTINCTIVRMSNIPNVVPPPLQWQYRGDLIVYNDPSHTSVYYTVVSHVVGLTVMSIATINSVQISDHDNNITCRSQISTRHSETIAIAGAASPPSNLSIINKPPVSLTWLAPPNGPTDCVFNYTINITNYSSSSSCYSTSNTESLILTDDLITRGHNYSFAVAVTDSTGQHGPWSDQLTVTYDVPGMVVSLFVIICFVHAKGKKQQKVPCNSNTYSQNYQMVDTENRGTHKNVASIYADLAAPNDVPPPRPPPPVAKAAKRTRGELIYADLGTVPLHNKPAIPPPPLDKVIYSDARELVPKKEISSNKERQLIYADLGTAPGKRPVAAPAHDKVVYSTVHNSGL